MDSIYGLIDPRSSEEIRYVGYTSRSLDHRLKDHLRDARKGYRTHRACWIRSLTRTDLSPEIVLLDRPVGPWQEAEIEWIASLRKLGHRLTNATDGGDGTVGATWKLSEETKAKMRKPKSAETRARMSAARKLRPPMSEETKLKIRAAHIGKSLSAAHRAAIGKAGTGKGNGMYGRTHSADARAKIGAARKKKGATWAGGKHTPETIARLRQIAQNRPPEHYEKVAAAMRGKAQTQTPETRAKRAIAAHVRWHVNRGIRKPSCPYCE